MQRFDDIYQRFITVPKAEDAGYYYTKHIPIGLLPKFEEGHIETNPAIRRITLRYERVGFSRRNPGRLVYELIEVLG